MAKIVNDSLIPSKPNAPLDKRTEVDNLSKIGEIDNPAPSLIIFDKETKQHYVIKRMEEEMIPGTNIPHKVIKEVEPMDGLIDYEEVGDVDLDEVFDQEGMDTMDVGDAPVIDFDSLS